MYRDSLDVNLITIETNTIEANAWSLIVRLLRENETIPQARRHGTRLAVTRSLGGDFRFAIANYFLILTHQLSIRMLHRSTSTSRDSIRSVCVTIPESDCKPIFVQLASWQLSMNQYRDILLLLLMRTYLMNIFNISKIEKYDMKK